jgi:hypothetical protein
MANNNMTPENMNNEPTKGLEVKNGSVIKLVSDPFEVMDKMDDKLIIAEIEGRIVDTWVYHFKDETGREQWGLSKVGVDACCTELAKRGEVIRELEIKYEVDPTDKEYMLFIAKAGRFAVARDGKEVLLDTAIGTKRQGLFGWRRDGTKYPNNFWFEQGAVKALRNARGRLIDEEIKSKVISWAKGQGKTQEVPVNASSRPVSEVSSGDIISEAQMKSIFAHLNRLKVTKDELKAKFAIESMTTLSKREASNIISDLSKMKDWPS